MCRLIRTVWHDDYGALLSLEWLLLGLLLVFGLITGLVAARQALLSELGGTASAIMALNQEFSFSGQTNCESSTAGSSADLFTKSIANGSVSASSSRINHTPCD